MHASAALSWDPIAHQENGWTKGWPHYGLPFSWDYMSCYDAFYCPGPEKTEQRDTVHLFQQFGLHPEELKCKSCHLGGSLLFQSLPSA